MRPIHSRLRRLEYPKVGLLKLDSQYQTPSALRRPVSLAQRQEELVPPLLFQTVPAAGVAPDADVLALYQYLVSWFDQSSCPNHKGCTLNPS